MNYIDFLEKRYQKLDSYELVELSINSEKLKYSKNEGERILGNNYLVAIKWILKSKNGKFVDAFNELRRLIYEQKRIY